MHNQSIDQINLQTKISVRIIADAMQNALSEDDAPSVRN